MSSTSFDWQLHFHVHFISFLLSCQRKLGVKAEAEKDKNLVLTFLGRCGKLGVFNVKIELGHLDLFS